MSPTLTLQLGSLGVEALRWYTAGGATAEQGVRLALRYFLAEEDGDSLARRVPPFARDGSDGDGPTGLDVEVDDATWRALAGRAAGEGVATEVLARHAVLYFLSDLDSGRLATRLADALGDGETP